MTLLEAQTIVLSSYPEAYVWTSKYYNGRTTLYLFSNKTKFEFLGWIVNQPNHPLPHEKFIELLWIQTAYKIMKETLDKLES